MMFGPGSQFQIKTRIGNHSMHATGITDYLKSDGTLEHAQTMAAHPSPRTTKLYDRRSDEERNGGESNAPKTRLVGDDTSNRYVRCRGGRGSELSIDHWCAELGSLPECSSCPCVD
jgi:hypothetical protein